MLTSVSKRTGLGSGAPIEDAVSFEFAGCISQEQLTAAATVDMLVLESIIYKVTHHTLD